MTGPPSYVVDIFLVVRAMVQLDDLVQQGQANSAQPIAECLFQDAKANASWDFARRVRAYRNTRSAPELKLALQPLALQRACCPWSSLVHDDDDVQADEVLADVAHSMTFWPANCPLNDQLQQWANEI